MFPLQRKDTCSKREWKLGPEKESSTFVFKIHLFILEKGGSSAQVRRENPQADSSLSTEAQFHDPEIMTLRP